MKLIIFQLVKTAWLPNNIEKPKITKFFFFFQDPNQCKCMGLSRFKRERKSKNDLRRLHWYPSAMLFQASLTFFSLELALTLCISTTHICVENTVLASMNCFLFNLYYNVMIMCKWHRPVYCHHHTQQTDYTSRFSLHITVRLATKPKMPIFRPNNITKIYTYLLSIFNPNNLFKKGKV